MSHAHEGRVVVNAHTTSFLPYDLEGPVQPEMSWLPVSFDRETQHGSYLMRMQPGAVTIAHDHPGMEEFLILEGDLVDSDGSVFGPGTVSYEAVRITTRGRRQAACSPCSSGSAPVRLKAVRGHADSESDSRLGTDGNQPWLELREGAADDAALLIRPRASPTISLRNSEGTERGAAKPPLPVPGRPLRWRNRASLPR